MPHVPGVRLDSSLYYDDFAVGDVFHTRAHTLTDDDLARFGDVTFDHHPLHHDDALARSMGFERRIAHGLLGLSMMEGLKSELGLYETTSVASLGWDAVRFHRAVLSGDTVRAYITIETRRLSKKPGRGVVTERIELLNQRDELAISAVHATLLLLRE